MDIATSKLLSIVISGEHDGERSEHAFGGGVRTKPHFGVRSGSGFECKPLLLLNVSLSYQYGRICA